MKTHRDGSLLSFLQKILEMCLEFCLEYSHVILRPQPGYMQILTTLLGTKCRACEHCLEMRQTQLCHCCVQYAACMFTWTTRRVSKPFQKPAVVCFGGQQKGKAVSKQRMTHWIVDTIALAYQAQGVMCPLRVQAHSTRSVASSWAQAKCVSLTE